MVKKTCFFLLLVNLVFVITTSIGYAVGSCDIEPPSNIITTEITASSISLTWNCPFENIYSYNVYVGSLLVANVTDTAYQVKNLNPAEEYTITITSMDNAQNESSPASISCYTLFDAPANIVATPHPTSLDISWSAVQLADYYELRINGITINNIYSTSYACSGLQPGQSYSIQVRAKSTFAEGEWSNPLSNATLDGTYVSGNITHNTSWTVNNSPYVITDTITISSGVTLSVEPGVVVRFKATNNNKPGLYIDGKLEAQGSELLPIVFTSYNDASYWGSGSINNWGIIIVSQIGQFNTNFAKIRYGGDNVNSAMVLNAGGILSLLNSDITESKTDGIYVSTSSKHDNIVENCRITNCRLNGITIYSSNEANIDLKNNIITGCLSNGIYLYGITGGTLNLEENSISNCTKYSMYINTGSFKPTVITGFETNSVDEIGLSSGTCRISIDFPAYTYEIEPSSVPFEIGSGTTITFEPGSLIKSKYTQNYKLMITVNGTLNAIGTPDKPVVFTTDRDPVYGGMGELYYWSHIYIPSGVFNADNVIIRYGGDNVNSATVLNTGGKISLINSEISESKTDGIYISTSSQQESKVENCKITNCQLNGITIYSSNQANISLRNNIITGCLSNGIYLYGITGGILDLHENRISNCTKYSIYINTGFFKPTVITGFETNSVDEIGLSSGTCRINIDFPAYTYEIEPSSVPFEIGSGTIVTFSPGSIIKSAHSQSYKMMITVNGTFNAIGTFDKPIVFTSDSDPEYGGVGSNTYWSNIIILNGVFNADYVRIKYAGDNVASLINGGGKLNITNSYISYSKSSGIHISSSDISRIENSVITNCINFGIVINAPLQTKITIKNNCITNCSDYGLYVFGYMTVDARFNYWGSKNGPSTPAHLTDGSKINAGVSYIPYYGNDLNYRTQFGKPGAYGPSRNFSQQFTDLSTKSSVSLFNLSRTYNSKDDRSNSLFGRGWTFNFEGSISNAQSKLILEDGTESTIDIPDTKTVRAPNGAVYQFILNSDGTYTSMYAKTVKLAKNADNTYTLTTNDQTQVNYNVDGTLHSVSDRYGNTDVVNYIDNKLSSIVDSAGHVYNFSYTGDHVASITDMAGDRTVTYEYENGNLARSIDPTGSITRYSYDSVGFLTSIRDNDNNLVESVVYNHTDTDDKDKITQTTDALGNTLTYSYDNVNKTVTTVDSSNRTTVQWYDDSLYVTKTLDPENGTSTTEYTLTSGSNKYGEVLAQTDRNGNKTSFLWDANGNNTQITNPDSGHKIMTYDDKNNLISQEDESGKKTYYIYDPSKVFLQKKVQPLNGTSAYAGSDDQFAVTNFAYYSEAERTALGYGVKGLVKAVTDPQGGITAFTYDANGNYKTKNNPLNKETTYTYNPMGWLQEEVSPSGYHASYIYDANGVSLKKVLNGGETYRTVHDAEGRVIKEILPKLYNSALDTIDSDSYSGDCGTRYTYYASGKVQAQTDAQGNTTGYTYDNYGNALTETKPNGAVYRYEYDKLDRVVKAYYKETAAASEVLLEEYTYSILSNHNTKTVEKKYIDSTASVSTANTYDYAGRLIQTQNPDSTVTSTLYNPNGTIAQTTDANAKTTYYSYDGLNRLTDKWAPFEQGSSAVQYAYTGYSYDKADRKAQEKTGKATVLANNLPTEFVTATYEYYLDGTLKSKTDSSGAKSEYEYDASGLLSVQKDYTDSSHFNNTEYENNYWGKPVTKKVSVRKGDLSGNDFGSDDVTLLQTSYTYDANGNIATETDPKGVVTTYGYDNLNRQTSVSQPGIDEHSAPVTIATSQAYDSMGNVISRTDANGNVTNYVFDGRGFLLKTVDALNGVALNSYDRMGRLLAAVTSLNYRDGQPLSSMNRTEYTYDPMGRVKTVSQVYYNTAISQWVSYVNKASKYDANGNVIKVLDSLGYAAGTGSSVDDKINSGYGTESTYNYANLLLTTLTPVSKSQSLSFTTKYTYDAAGRKVSETGANNAITLYTYDDAGNLLLSKVKKNQAAPEVTIQTKTYDKLGHVLTQTDGTGNTVSFAYNALGKVSAVTYPHDSTIAEYTVYSQYDKLGNLARTLDNNSTEELFTYDNQGRQLSDKKQKSGGTDAITTHIAYDKGGNKRFDTDGNGNVAENVYDALNRMTQTKIEVFGIDQATAYTYDASGNLLTTTDWLGNVTSNEYDPLNRVIVKKDAYGKAVEKLQYNNNDAQIASTDALNNVTQYTYDRNNRLLTTTDSGNHVSGKTYDYAGNVGSEYDGKNNTTWYDYDEYNRLIKVTNPKGEQTAYTYDLNGNMLTQTDGKENTKTFEYNVINKLARSIDVGGRAGTAGSYTYDPARTVSYSYDKNGDLHSMTDRNGVTTTYTYDSHGRMLSQQAGTATISFTYDGNGNQLTMTDATGTTTRTYDALNRTLTKSVPVIGTATYVYNITAGQPTGTVAEQSVDPAGNVVVKAYDKAGRLHSVTDGADVTLYDYYDNGAKRSVTYSNGAKEEYTYLEGKLLSGLINRRPNGSVMDSYSYAYDAAHNQTSKTETVNGVQKGTTSYTYDALNRLLTVLEPGGRITVYGYDASGNRSTETMTVGTNITTKTYSYDPQNRLTGLEERRNDVTQFLWAYGYDNNGNLLSTRQTTYVGGEPQMPYAETTNTYDPWNQLIQTVTQGSTVLNTYNGEGLRVAKSVNGSETRYFYEYTNIVLETNDGGIETARNVFGTNLLKRVIGTSSYNYFYNGHSDVTALMDVFGGTIAAAYYYDAFGVVLESAGTVNNSILYAGYQYDKETGYYYLNARMYDPATARFLQEDTYAGKQNDPLSLNLYVYVKNNPLIYTDPTGHREMEMASWEEERKASRKVLDEYKRYSETERKRKASIKNGQDFVFATAVVFGKSSATEKQGAFQYLSEHSDSALVKAIGVWGFIQNEPMSLLERVYGAFVNQGNDIQRSLGNDYPDQDLSRAETSVFTGYLFGKMLEGNKLPSKETAGTLSNAFPKNGRFATVMPKKFAEQLAKGEGKLSGGAEAWITAADDLAGINTVEGAANRLTLIDEAGNMRLQGDAVVEFEFKDMSGIASPYNRSNPGFISGGKTEGGAREWLMPSDAHITNIKIRYLKK